MGCKSPSKFLSLAFLKEVQATHYMSEGGINYEAAEVDALIIEKEEKASEALVLEFDVSDFEEIIPAPTDEDMAIEVEAVIIPASTLNRLFNSVAVAARKVWRMVTAKHEAVKAKVIAKVNKTKVKVGGTRSKYGKKIKINISLDEDLFIMAEASGNRSHYVNNAVRRFLEGTKDV